MTLTNILKFDPDNLITRTFTLELAIKFSKKNYSKLRLLKREPNMKDKRLSGFFLMGSRVKRSMKLSIHIIEIYHQKMEFGIFKQGICGY